MKKAKEKERKKAQLKAKRKLFAASQPETETDKKKELSMKGLDSSLEEVEPDSVTHPKKKKSQPAVK